MSIRLRCPSGHKLRADEEHAGLKANCPRCGKQVLVPRRPSPRLSDSSIVALLSEDQGRMLPPERICLRCKASIPGPYQVCPNCHCFQA